MELTAELLGAAGAAIVIILAGASNYLRSLKAPHEPPSAMLAGIGLGYVEREQMERLVAAVTRIADAIGDKNAAGINHQLQEQADRIDDLMKLLDRQSTSAPPRRR